MVRHTLATLGPKVLASPDGARLRAASSTRRPRVSSRAVLAGDAALAKELAAYAATVREAWPGVRVEHVEASGVGDSPGARHRALGARLRRARRPHRRRRARCELVSGRVDHNDRIVHAALHRARARSRGTRATAGATRPRVGLDDTGPFGYTVRVLPEPRGSARPGRARSAGAARRAVGVRDRRDPPTSRDGADPHGARRRRVRGRVRPSRSTRNSATERGATPASSSRPRGSADSWSGRGVRGVEQPAVDVAVRRLRQRDVDVGVGPVEHHEERGVAQRVAVLVARERARRTAPSRGVPVPGSCQSRVGHRRAVRARATRGRRAGPRRPGGRRRTPSGAASGACGAR